MARTFTTAAESSNVTKPKPLRMRAESVCGCVCVFGGSEWCMGDETGKVVKPVFPDSWVLIWVPHYHTILHGPKLLEVSLQARWQTHTHTTVYTHSIYKDRVSTC